MKRSTGFDGDIVNKISAEWQRRAKLVSCITLLCALRVPRRRTKRALLEELKCTGY